MLQPRITYVIPSLGVGGAETQLIRLIRGLVTNFEINVVCTREAGAYSTDAYRLGARVDVVECRTAWDPRMEGKLRDVFLDLEPDIVHTFMFGFDLAPVRAAREAGVPTVISSRRELATWMKARHRVRQLKANDLVGLVVANSRAVAGYAIETEDLNPAMVRVVYNGIDAAHYQSSAENAVLRDRYELPAHGPIIGTVANFSPVKDYPLFLDTAAELADRIPGAHFLLVGSGPEEDRIEEQIERLGLRNRTTCLSTIAGIADIYALLDVFVLTSKTEGLPNAVMEAMAARAPVVAAAVGGVPELIEDGVTGRLVTERNPTAFAGAVEDALRYPGHTELMAIDAQRQIETKFSVKAMVAAYREIYESALANTRPRSA